MHLRTAGEFCCVLFDTTQSLVEYCRFGISHWSTQTYAYLHPAPACHLHPEPPIPHVWVILSRIKVQKTGKLVWPGRGSSILRRDVREMSKTLPGIAVDTNPNLHTHIPGICFFFQKIRRIFEKKKSPPHWKSWNKIFHDDHTLS